MWLAGYVNVSHEMDGNLNISPKMSHGVLECDIVMLQNCMLKGVICAGPCIFIAFEYFSKIVASPSF